MSILMDALKQHTQPDTSEPLRAVRRSRLPVVLLVLFALLSGFAAGWLVLSHKQAVVAEQQAQKLAEQAATPANPAEIPAILADITSILSQPEPKVVIEEVFDAEQEIVTVTAQTEPVTVPVTAPVEEMSVSDELRDKFALALQATENRASSGQQLRVHNAPARDISALDLVLQRQIPPLRFDAHVYATTPAQRWVKVNGKNLQEGQWVTSDIRIREITAQYVLLEMGQQLFSIRALTEWSGS